MNASLNVTSGFAFNKTYDFEDPQFEEIAEIIESYFAGITSMALLQMSWNILPRWEWDLKNYVIKPYFIDSNRKIDLQK